MKSRLPLKQRIRDELDWGTRFDAGDIDIDVADGVVRLAGTVGSYAEKLAVQDVVRWLDEVRDVVDDIVVRPDQLLVTSDADLARIVRDVLVWDALVPDETITTDISDGWVTLAGSVSVRAQRAEAERAIRHLAGIRGITNVIEIADVALAPAEIRSVIGDALERRALHAAARINVTIDGHNVLLAGRVQSAAEKRALLGAVGHAEGVESVTDGLIVEAG